jgi:uncharacterized protein (TIGR03435 family)
MPSTHSTLRSDFRPALLCAALAALFALALPARAQTPPPPLDPSYTPTMTFDIASIRQTEGVVGGALKVGTVNPTHSSKFEATNFTAKSLLQLAYGFGTPISGAPEWFTDRYFNVQAKSDAAADAALAKLTDDQARMEKQHMLQAMLADRLGLKTHWETRETAVYALVVAKGGSKLHEVTVPHADADPAAAKPASTNPTDVKATGGARGLEFDAEMANTRSIAAMLVSQVGTPVIDRTGLTGTYKFVLQFGREWSERNPESWPDILVAVQEQLGLKLEPVKAAVPVLVIDHVELPSAN